MVVPGRGAEAVRGDSSSLEEGEGHTPAVVEGEGFHKIQREGGHHREHTAGSSLQRGREREVSKWPLSPKLQNCNCFLSKQCRQLVPYYWKRFPSI